MFRSWTVLITGFYFGAHLELECWCIRRSIWHFSCHEDKKTIGLFENLIQSIAFTSDLIHKHCFSIGWHDMYWFLSVVHWLELIFWLCRGPYRLFVSCTKFLWNVCFLHMIHVFIILFSKKNWWHHGSVTMTYIVLDGWCLWRFWLHTFILFITFKFICNAILMYLVGGQLCLRCTSLKYLYISL